MDFSPGALAANFVFGVFGWFILRQGKREGSFQRAALGITLMAYGYFVENVWLNWGVGASLLAFHLLFPGLN